MMMVVQPHLLLHTDRQTDRFVLEVSRNMLRQTNKQPNVGVMGGSEHQRTLLLVVMVRVEAANDNTSNPR
jgi:hypothetical protein